MAEVFELKSAAALVGQRVKLTCDMDVGRKGDTGTISSYIEYKHGYVLRVNWDRPHLGGRPRFTYFDQPNYREFLTEI